jgi:hypothetical protein
MGRIVSSRFMAIVLVMVMLLLVGNNFNIKSIDSVTNTTETNTTETKPKERLLCTQEQLTRGRWVQRTYDRPPYIPMRGEKQQNACPNLQKNRPWSSWEWKTTERCMFSQRFDPNLFCKFMKNKTMAIIGDSISFDQYFSLTHLLGEPKVLPKARRKDANLVSDNLCNGTFRLVGQRDFYLQRIASVVRDTFPDVLVMERPDRKYHATN